MRIGRLQAGRSAELEGELSCAPEQSARMWRWEMSMLFSSVAGVRGGRKLSDRRCAGVFVQMAERRAVPRAHKRFCRPISGEVQRSGGPLVKRL